MLENGVHGSLGCGLRGESIRFLGARKWVSDYSWLWSPVLRLNSLVG